MSRSTDKSTCDVCQWLLHYKIPFLRINGENIFEFIEIRINEKEIEFSILSEDCELIKLSDVKAYWYRRGDLKIKYGDLSFIKDGKLRNQVEAHLNGELEVLEDFFYYLLSQKPYIDLFATRSLNKLKVLSIAKAEGLAIPPTLVATSKSKIRESTLINDNLITKSLYDSIGILDSRYGAFTTYTEAIIPKEIKENFFPSLFQTCFEKEADIRVFYFFGEMYSMAIRSQNNKQTVTDFRKYVHELPNRCFPFKLPDQLKIKLKQVMNRLKLNTGSIDFIFTKTGELIFLEINPVGQFGMVSKPCNYYLEKLIARKLIDLSTQE